MDLTEEVYRGGFYTLVKRFEKKQAPFNSPLAFLPPVECDLTELEEKIVSPPDAEIVSFPSGTTERKDLEFRAEFQGQSQLLYLHAMLVAISRRNSPPPEVPILFQRLWKEKGSWLGRNLNIRWRISAATTFADCGVTMEQRSLGMGLSVLFDTMKLYESERRMTGLSGDGRIESSEESRHIKIAFDMQPYSIKIGDLDRNMLSRLWTLAEQDDVVFHLAKSMLFELMQEKRTIFSRIQRFKDELNVDD